MKSRCTVRLNLLLDYIDGRQADKLDQWVGEHLANGCGECRPRVRWLRELKEELGEWTTELVVARPIPDRRLESVPMALRSGLAGVRQRLFEALSDIRIDIQTEEIERGSLCVEGQVIVFGSTSSHRSGVKVALYQDGQRLAECAANQIGEFEFLRLRSGRYNLTATVDAVCVIIPDLDL